MINEKHTPGPWKLLEVGGLGHLCPADGNGISILTVVTEGDVDFAAVYEDADARLIAAAPELLEALQNLLNDTQHKEHQDCDDGPCPVREARAAIAKATGGAL